MPSAPHVARTAGSVPFKRKSIKAATKVISIEEWFTDAITGNSSEAPANRTSVTASNSACIENQAAFSHLSVIQCKGTNRDKTKTCDVVQIFFVNIIRE